MDAIRVDCAILAIDIEKFGAPARTDLVQARLRQRLHDLVDRTLGQAGIRPWQIVSRRDLGDGLLILADQEILRGPAPCRLIAGLASALAWHNHAAPSAPERFRLRVAIHRGTLLGDAHGHTGHALIHAFRLLDAEIVRAVLGADPAADLVVVVSDVVHADLEGAEGAAVSWLQPAWLAHKETTARAWVHLAGVQKQPSLAELLQKAVAAAPETARGEDAVRRRELLAFSGTLMGSATLRLLVGERRPSVEDALVAGRVARRLHRMDESLPVGRVDAARSRHAAAVHWLAGRAEQPRVRAGLLRALAHTQAVGGVMAVGDLHDQRLAERRFRMALRAAEQAGDPVLAGMVCLRMSEAALSAHRLGEAVELASAGRGLVGPADPALHATLRLAEAGAHQAAGARGAALRSLDAGEELVLRSPPSPWTRVDAARYAGGCGMVEGGLGRWDQAVEGLRTGIGAYPPGNGLRAVLLAHLARARFAQQAPEEAAALATEALTVALRFGSSARLAALEPLHPWLERYRAVPEVEDLADQLSCARSRTTRRPSGRGGR